MLTVVKFAAGAATLIAGFLIFAVLFPPITKLHAPWEKPPHRCAVGYPFWNSSFRIEEYRKQEEILKPVLVGGDAACLAAFAQWNRIGSNDIWDGTGRLSGYKIIRLYCCWLAPASHSFFARMNRDTITDVIVDVDENPRRSALNLGGP